MKIYNILLGGVLMLLPLTVAAQKVKLDAKVVDLGQVQYYQPTTGTFELRNTSKHPITITNVDTGCGCTIASYPTTPVSPGNRFNVQVTYDAKMMGHFDKVIEVYTSASRKPLLLELRGVVVEEVEDYIGDFPFAIGSLTADCNYMEFEDVRKGQVLQQKIHVYNPTGKTVEPQVMHLPPYLSASISPSKVPANKSAEITITLDSHKITEYGLSQTQIYIGANPGERVSSDKEIGVAAVILSADHNYNAETLKLAPQLKMSANSLFLPIADGKKKSKTIEMQNVGRTTLEIQNVQMYTSGLQVSLNKTSIEPGEIAKLKITTDPKMLKRVRTRPRVLIITNDPNKPKVIVDIETGK